MKYFALFRASVFVFCFAVIPFLPGPVAFGAEDEHLVTETVTKDKKAVFATVETIDVISARARIGGTVTRLDVDEGSSVKAKQVIAVVRDKKLQLNLTAINSRIQSLMSERDLAQTTYSRSKKLFESGTIPKARLDETESALKVIERNLNAMQAERRVITQQMTEGEVLAPTQGRVIRVDVTTGTVVLAGEPIAIIAGQGFILRMRVPERHARFLKGGDRVLLGARGADERALEPGAPLREGIIRQVYPKLEQGRVVADISVTDLGDYFVGERISVYVNTGDRRIIVVPQAYLFQRYGLTFVRLKDGSEVVVQPGQNTIGGIEILSGLRVGDILIRPSSDGT